MGSQIEITETGIEVPQSSDIKQVFQGIFINAFGTDLSLDDSTPQGSMIDDFTREKQESNTRELELFNQFNPDTAEGVFQDALGLLFGMKRKLATPSVVNCECIGVENTVIPQGAMAQSVGGDLFTAIESKTIGASGTVTVQFESVEKGKISVGANTVNKIYSVVAGWDAVNNSVAGSEGSETESREDFEARRKKELARNATGSLGAVYSELSEVDGVTDVFVWENPTDTSVTYRGVTMGAFSVYLCVNGGSPADLGEAIYKSKSAGCATTSTASSITCSYTDPLTSVQYSFNVDRPTLKPIDIKITTSAVVSSGVQEKIIEAIKADWNGEGDDVSISIASPIYASRFYADIARLNINELQLVSVKVSDDGGTTWSDVLTFNMDELPTIDDSDISFVSEV